MKSKHPDSLLQTSCKECLFATYDGKTQTGCEANRIAKFEDYVIEAYDDEKEFYVIDCLCNYHRLPSWNDGKADLSKVIDENKPTFAVILDTDNITKAKADTTLNSILSMDYDYSKMGVVLSQNSPLNKAKRGLINSLRNRLVENDIYTSVIVNLNPKTSDVETFRKTGRRSHFIKTYIGQEIPRDAFNRIHEELNETLKRAVYFEFDEVEAISCMTFASTYLEYCDYKLFKEETKNKSIEQNLYLDMRQGA